jgi:hypothetical protein
MLQKKIKWGIIPVVAMAMIAGLSAFTGESESVQCRTSCAAGGCGSNSCSYTKEIFGLNRTVSVTANSGYYACCYTEGTNMYANSYPNSCCN